MTNKKIKNLTLKEKATMLVGASSMRTYGVPEKGVEGLFLSDGPNGLRCEDPETNAANSIVGASPATCFPTGITMASTWNADLLQEVGVAMGKECVGFEVNVLLGPAVNIQRNPLCGRNFEYYSEDPVLAGTLGTSVVKGVQSQGVGACVKHFACNNNEKFRFVGDSVVDQRALHEIYLKPFEMVVKDSDPRAIMTCYNQVNGTFGSENKYLLEDMLRKSWGFDGIVMTDWGAIVHRDVALLNGCDLEMPGVCDYNIKLIYDGVKNGAIPEEVVDKSVQRLIDCKERTTTKRVPADLNAHYQLALSVALEGAVLLKNDNTLPLSKDNKYLVIGGLFDMIRYQGGGSSMINPAMVKDHKQAFADYGVNYEFVQGYLESELKPDEKLEKEALEKAKDYDTILFYGGLNDYVESEGYDGEDLKIPANQISLLDKLTKLGKKIVVVLFGGSPMELPFFDGVNAILDMQLPGEAGGEATTKLLFGEVNPSGKLSQTWPYQYSDIPFGNEFTSSLYELYKESIFVGYRYYSTVKKEVRFPFGYGLSYTTFEYSKLTIKQEKDGLFASFLVKNIGKVNGKEVAQLYVGKADSNVVRPAIELKGFAKVELNPGEEKEVSIFVKKDLLGVWVNDGFVIEDGEYQIYVGGSSNNLPLQSSIVVEGEQLQSSQYDEVYQEFLKTNNVSKENFEKIINRVIPEYIYSKKPYTLETPIGELRGFFGGIFRRYTCGLGMKQYHKAKKIKDPIERERQKKGGLFMALLMPNNSLRSLCFSSAGMLSYSQALGILELCNGHPIRCIKQMKKKYKIEE